MELIIVSSFSTNNMVSKYENHTEEIIMVNYQSMIIIINTTTAFKGGSVQVALSFLIEFRKFKIASVSCFVGPWIKSFIEFMKDFPENFKFYFFKHRPLSKAFLLQSHYQ